MNKLVTCNIKILLCVAVAFLLLSDNVFYIYAINNTDSDRVIVSMGDSFSSGEGIDNFYDYNLPIAQRVKSEDWLAHRSQESWPGRLTLPGVDGTMKDHRNKNWYFVAASGAETKDIVGRQEKTYNKNESAYADTAWLPAQISVFDQVKKDNKKTDYVTLTLGGNDLGFSDIITAAVVPKFINKGALADKLNFAWKKFYGKTKDDLRKSYELISNAAGEQATIIVAGYPKLLDEGNVVYEIGNGMAYLIFEFDTEEVQMINSSVTHFNEELENLITSCYASGMKICFAPVDTGEGSFEGHEAYSDFPYINEVSLEKKEQDIDDSGLASEYSIHPNTYGAQVYANRVQEKIDEIEKNGGQLEAITRTTSDERDIVVVLDTSGSMSGKPMEETKKAASKFVDTVLEQDASIGIVTYENSANMISDFSVDGTWLKSVANNITGGGGTNIESGLTKAKEMLAESNAKKKIIVLMSDGEPNDGKVGDELISYADSIKADGTYIYTLGFFKNMGSGKSDAQVLMEEIASDGCHYEVADADDLKFFFGDIADQINGQKYIYVRIACPVDVKVTYNGETLRSDEDDINERTSFGSLTFEENKNASEDGGDNRIKILRLKDGTDYDVQIEGNGSGKMNYTIGFMDESGEYSDMRKFSNVEITTKTQIDTVAGNTSSTTLNVDSDGDGKYDLKYKAKANSEGEIVDYSYIRYIIYITGVLIILLILYIQIKRWKRKSAEKAIKKKASQKKFCVHCGNTVSGDKKFCPKCGKKIE